VREGEQLDGGGEPVVQVRPIDETLVATDGKEGEPGAGALARSCQGTRLL